MAKFSIFFDILRPHFQNRFVPIFFNVFVAKLKEEHKKAIENRTPGYNQCKISFKKTLFFKVNYGRIKIFFQNSGTTFSKQFFLNVFFNVFCAKVKDITLKSYWKLNNSVLLSTLWILLLLFYFFFLSFSSIFAALRHSFYNFYNFFHGFRSMSGKMWFIR